MTARRVEERLEHMLDSLRAIRRLAAGKTLDGYRADPDRAAAVERYLERLSEASRHLPDTLKATRPEIAAVIASPPRGRGDPVLPGLLRRPYGLLAMTLGAGQSRRIPL